MSYYIVDADGRFKGDVATIQGLQELEDIAGEALAEFLDTGEADDALVEEIIIELESDKNLAYLKPAFEGKAPFVLTDGVEDEDQS
jgi:hypothetical protein